MQFVSSFATSGPSFSGLDNPTFAPATSPASHVIHFTRPASQEETDSAAQPERVVLQPVPRRARISVVEPQFAEAQPLNAA